jgi:hypothetical protein
VTKYFICFFVVGLLASCGQDFFSISSSAKSSKGYPFAYVGVDCGPTDGIDLVFYFTAKEGKSQKLEEPYIVIAIDERTKPAPGDYSIEERDSPMRASRCASSGQCARATSGTLHLTKYTARGGASGAYELHFQDGSVERASFDATWRALEREPLICG